MSVSVGAEIKEIIRTCTVYISLVARLVSAIVANEVLYCACADKRGLLKFSPSSPPPRSYTVDSEHLILPSHSLTKARVALSS